MAYSDEEIEEVFDVIINRISEGESLKSVLRSNNMPAVSTFYVWMKDGVDKSNLYAHATKLRADVIFDEIFEIADNSMNDFEDIDIGEGVVVRKPNLEHIQRDRLRVDARKWALSKMNPKKYGDKVDVTTDGKELKVIGFLPGGLED